MNVVAVSVIVPTRNRQEQLIRCLLALGSVVRPDGGFEVIVVNDGGSPLPTVPDELADGLSVTCIEREWSGPAATRNAGAAAAGGHLLVFTDDDCEPAAEWLRVLEGQLVASPGSVVGGRMIPSNPDNSWAVASQLLIDHLYRWYNRDPGRARFLTSNNLAVAAATFWEVGGFHTGFPTAAAEDREFTERTLRSGHRLVFVPQAVVRHGHRLTGRSFLRQHYGYGRGAHRLFRRRREVGGSIAAESPRFYIELLRTPLREPRHPRPLRLSALLALSQLVHAIGFIREALAPFRRRSGSRSASAPAP